jgi:TonB C terminal
VTTHRQVAVSEWSESLAPIIPPRHVSRRIWSPAVIGLVGTLLLHGLALQAAYLSDLAHKVRPPTIRQSDSLLSEAAAKPTDNLVLIDLQRTLTTDNPAADALALARATVEQTPIIVNRADPTRSLNLEILTLNDEEPSKSSIDSGDGTERARLLGIYTGQIQARVERVWRRPRTPVEEGSDSGKSANSVDYFYCQVQIVQDLSGNVQEILLPNCNGSIAWQRSLLLAIQEASPLPAPPSATVFSYSIAVDFHGYAYTKDSTEEGYEPRPETVARMQGQSSP